MIYKNLKVDILTINLIVQKSYENGELKIGKLLEHSKINQIYFRENSYVEFYENRKFKNGFLAYETNINGIIFKANTYISFFENSKIKNIGYF